MLDTGKPDQDTLKKYPHYLIDHCSVSEIYNVAEFINDASILAKNTLMMEKFHYLLEAQ